MNGTGIKTFYETIRIVFSAKSIFSILPNNFLKKGKETVRAYDLERPRYRREIVKGGDQRTVKETGTSVSFHWFLLEIVYDDPFRVWFFMSLAISLCYCYLCIRMVLM